MNRYYNDVRYPEGCNSIIDVTKAPYFCDNTGKEDCTEKLVALIDELMSEHVRGIKKLRDDLANSKVDIRIGISNRRAGDRIFPIHPYMSQTPTIYFPNGTYLVSDTVSYTLRDLHNMMYFHTSGGYELSRCIRIMGQSEKGTVIKLKDNCKGFEWGQRRAVLSVMNGERSNVAMSNYIENLTIDVGKGNAGAVGIVFFSNNAGAIRNVTVRSSDENHDGAIGLLIEGEAVSAANVYNLTVDGFKYGVKINSFRTFSHFENLTLNDQQKYGITVLQNEVSVIGLKSRSSVPVVYLCGPLAHVIVTEAQLVGDTAEYPAVKVDMGYIFLRNIDTVGFKNAYERCWGEISVPNGHIDEYSTDKGYTLFGGEAKTLALKVPPFPDIPREPDFKKWACVNDFGAVGDGVHDDTAAIQAAFDSGYPVIWFKSGHYLITDTIEIPASVNHIHFMYCDIKSGGRFSEITELADDAIFSIKGDSDTPLLLEKLFSWDECIGWLRMFRHDSRRTVHFRDMHTQACAFYFNTVPGAEVFFENVACTIAWKNIYSSIPCFSFYKQTVWCHTINPERARHETENIGGQMWWSGFKTEQEGSINVTTDGGVTEILGGCAAAGAGDETVPLVMNDNSTVSAIFSCMGFHDYSTYPVAVRETRDGETREIRDRELPQRMSPWYIMPLYYGKKDK